MKRKQLVYFVIIAFLVGTAGSIFFNRIIFPKLAAVRGFSWVSKLSSSAPIIITRREEVRLNEGVNLIELTKQAQTIVVSIHSQSNQKFLGNGIVITSDGTIFTTKDVVGKDSQVNVVTNDGSVLTGLVRALDPKSPLAVITVQGKDMPVAQFSEAGLMQTAQRVIALGKTNEEFTREFATGMVTKTLSNNVDSDRVLSTETFENTITTDAGLTSNFIGGPLVNLQGLVIGMVVGPAGQILPAEAIDGAVKAYLSNGKISRPIVGIKYNMLTKSAAKMRGLNSAAAHVVEVSANSSAVKAGIQIGDYILKVNGQDVGASSLEQLLVSQGTNEVRLTVQKGTITRELTLTPEVR